MDIQHTVKIGEDQVHLCIDASLAPSALCAFLGRTPRDAEVDDLRIPTGPLWLNLAIRLLRWYRRIRPQSMSCRCVYDPSCSRYAELAYLKHGFFSGTVRIVRRLNNCRPGAGGTDNP